MAKRKRGNVSSTLEAYEIKRMKDIHCFQLFMRNVMYHIGPLDTGKLVSVVGNAPIIEDMYQEERFNYMKTKVNLSNIPKNGKGERLITLADDRIVKLEPINLEYDDTCYKRIKKIDFVDLSDE
ncbi:uncharacterized protein LOC110702741 [Chenopodium quinoa]|uniref:uncharacterized protein LOC110702741 n=1 Tax=Chenopodium quinoa TaxID=63459 RepID=UPI000B78CC0F|nr:uncharacterized protein LOC110702741 [Chenopodium quinoa]